MLFNTIVLALALGASAVSGQRNLRAFTDGSVEATRCRGGFFQCDNVPRGRCCFVGGRVISSGFITNSRFDDFITLQVRTDFNSPGCGRSAAQRRGGECVSAGRDGANAIRWEQPGGRRREVQIESRDEEAIRPTTFNFSEDGPVVDVTGMSDGDLEALARFARNGGSAESLPAVFAARLQ